MRLHTQLGLILLSVATATITEAQVAPLPRQLPPHQVNGNPAGAMSGYAGNGNSGAQKPAATVNQPPAASSPSLTTSPASLLDQPAAPAQIRLDAGKLAVQAENSNLSEILHDISSKTGMTVDGLSKDQRIFGSYGPASPRDVLSALLDGVGYNVLMVGDLSNGAPRQLLLTPRGASAASGSHGVQPSRQNNAGNDDEDDTTPDQPDNAPQPPIPAPNPPQANQEQPPATSPGQNGVRTPQQMLQELQQIRQQQQQQQPQ